MAKQKEPHEPVCRARPRMVVRPRAKKFIGQPWSSSASVNARRSVGARMHALEQLVRNKRLRESLTYGERHYV
jgi:hypothetical protein